MKAQVKRAFKSYCLAPKNNKKPEKLCMKFSSTFYKCAEVPISPISKWTPPFPANPPFRRIYHASDQDQQNGKKHTVSSMVVEVIKTFLFFFTRKSYKHKKHKKHKNVKQANKKKLLVRLFDVLCFLCS